MNTKKKNGKTEITDVRYVYEKYILFAILFVTRISLNSRSLEDCQTDVKIGEKVLIYANDAVPLAES